MTPRAFALACLLPLAACGGGDDEYQAGGSERESMVQLNALSGSGADNERAEALLDDLFACLPTP